MACEHFLMVPRHVLICHAHTDVVEYLMFMDYRKYNYFFFSIFLPSGGLDPGSSQNLDSGESGSLFYHIRSKSTALYSST
jgi:hypothetical protein